MSIPESAIPQIKSIMALSNPHPVNVSIYKAICMYFSFHAQKTMLLHDTWCDAMYCTVYSVHRQT